MDSAGNALKQYLQSFEHAFDNMIVYIVCNVKNRSSRETALHNTIYETEFLSDDEMEQIVEMFYQSNIPYEIFQSEQCFISSIMKKKSLESNIIVYNSAQSGTGAGRKSLIPAFCNLYGMNITGSNPYVVALCRHKYHVNKLLKEHGFPVPQMWLYDNGWLDENHPPCGMKIIIKPIYESASIGIESDSVVNYDKSIIVKLQEKQQIFNQPIAVQEFIPGYEAELPIIFTGKNYISLEPVGLSITSDYSMGNEILDFKKIYFDDYRFYDFTKLSVYQQQMQKTGERSARMLGMNGLCRIDFRITHGGKYYITDVSTNPHFIRHSSVHYAYLKHGLSELDILKTILSSALHYDSLQN